MIRGLVYQRSNNLRCIKGGRFKTRHLPGIGFEPERLSDGFEGRGYGIGGQKPGFWVSLCDRLPMRAHVFRCFSSVL